MTTEVGVRTKRCGICRNDLPEASSHFYRNTGEPGGFARCCKGCADSAKKRYKLKYNRNRQEKVSNVKPKQPRLSDRVQYALLTGRCPRCGGTLQRYVDAHDKEAPCMACLTCSREVWLPSAQEVHNFLSNPPQAVAMPLWVQRERKQRRRKRRKPNL